MGANLPHIVIFNPDQWRGDVMGHMGNPAAVTPVLDRLVAEEAVSFRFAACQNPVCTPSRCSFMSGWYPHVRGHRTMHHMLHPERGEPCLLRILKENGYNVWWGGKNDLAPGQDGYEAYCDLKHQPTHASFERWGLTPRPDMHSWQGWRGAADGDNYYSFYGGRLDAKGERIYADSDWAHVLGAIDFIRAAPRDRPLCLYLPLSYPHPPYGVEDPFWSMIDRAKLPRRWPAPSDWRGKPALLRGIAQRQGLTGWTEPWWDELRATYYGMCARVDHQLGLVIDTLREAGIYDDTALFFFSDHGDFTGDYGLVEKTQNTMEDCLVRVPLVVKPPRDAGVRPRVTPAMAELVDFPATVFDLTGIRPGYTHFGRSLMPVIRGQTDEHRDAVFCEGGRNEDETHADEVGQYPGKGPEFLYWPRVGLQGRMPEHGKATMCRTRDLKYVQRLYESDELYDLARDPGELRNVIDEPSYAPRLAQMRQRMLRWYAATADVVPWEIDRRN